MKESIDFVITWVDGNDSKWINERKKYISDSEKLDESRYRDWEILKYWFRAVEKYAPWVNKIFFVTWGHVPEWLNSSCEKLVIVNHRDFIEKKYLPTFNSCVIELNMHKIEQLSEKFVYFNDDMFLNDYTTKEDFFVKNLPCDNKRMSLIWKRGKKSTIINYNCAEIINDNFDINSFKTNKKVKLKDIIKYVCLLPQKPIWSMIPQHVPTSYLKETFSEVWNKNKEYLEQVCNDKFRQDKDVSQWLIQFWQMASGKYIEREKIISKYYEINSKKIDENLDEIKQHKYKLICLNDSEVTENFEENKEKIIACFEEMYPQKSAFEN